MYEAKYFSSQELACKCGCGGTITNEQLLHSLDNLRLFCGVPLHVDSGFRCPAHNLAVKGQPDSMHLLGLAADIKRPHGIPMIDFVYFAVSQFHFQLGGIGLYVQEDFLHLDVRGTVGESPYHWIQ